MMFFRRSTRPGQKASRPFLLAVIILTCCYAFWMNSQRRLDTIVLQGLFIDHTGLVGQDVKKPLLELLKTFKPSFGMPLEVSILTHPPDLSRHDPARIYLDVLPKQRRILLTLPPLIRRAAGDTFAQDIETMFTESFADNSWPQAILPATRAIQAKMVELNR